jgi:hypothetical protein
MGNGCKLLSGMGFRGQVPSTGAPHRIRSDAEGRIPGGIVRYRVPNHFVTPSLRHSVTSSLQIPGTRNPGPGTRYLSRSDAEDRGLEHAPSGFAIIPRVFGLSP